MDHPDLTVSNFMENYICLKRVKQVFSAINLCIHSRMSPIESSISVYESINSKTCLKGPLKKKIKKWFSIPSIA